MKKLLLSLLAMFASVQMYAQTPVLVCWMNGEDQVTIGDAQDGVQLKTTASANTTQTGSLKINCFFKASDIAGCGGSKDYEIKWYYYMSTRKSLMGTNVVTVNADNANSDGFCKFSCMKNNVRSGWWEVQIKDKANNAIVKYANMDNFPIKIN